MSKYLCVVLVMFGYITEAKSVQSKARKPAGDDVQMIATATVGGRVTRFTIKSVNGHSTMETVSSAGANQTKELTPENFAFIMAEFKKLPVPPTISKYCATSRMDIAVMAGSGPPQTKASCLGMKSITEPDYANFATLLVFAN